MFFAAVLLVYNSIYLCLALVQIREVQVKVQVSSA